MASAHGKERSCNLPFLWALGLPVRALPGLDTDALGTFCGEVERPGPASEVVCQKARLALVGERCTDLALASEASFGPHPVVPWAACHQEQLVLVDGLHGYLWKEVDSTLETNFAQATVANWEEARSFASRAGFPSHALMARTPSGPWLKGLQDWGSLPQEFPLTLATDMRAHFNPSRRRLLRRLALKLVRSLRTLCPVCEFPGFAVSRQVRGLPCSDCALPTAWISREIWTCQCCQHEEDRPSPDGLLQASPSHCEICNP